MLLFRSPPRVSPAVTTADDDQTVGSVLSTQARTRAASELWTTAVGGSMNALLVLTQFPRLHWLAAGFVAVAAYGIWGLLDRVLSVVELQNSEPAASRHLLRGLCGMTAVIGFSAALYAAGSFLTAALGPLSMPGR